MKIGTENRKQMYVAGVLGFVALVFVVPNVYSTFFGGSSVPPVQAPPVIRDVTVHGAGQTASASVSNKAVSAPPGFAVGEQNAAQVGKSDGALDPTLHMEAMLVTESLRYTGTGRNIFGGEAPAPPPTPKVELAKFGARPTPVVQPPVYSGPPPKPPINLKFFGTETNAAGVKRALLLNGDDVFLALPGDVVQRRYRVISIAANSIQVEDIPNDNKQTLPLVN